MVLVESEEEELAIGFDVSQKTLWYHVKANNKLILCCLTKYGEGYQAVKKKGSENKKKEKKS